jgi:hypothetical protein
MSIKNWFSRKHPKVTEAAEEISAVTTLVRSGTLTPIQAAAIRDAVPDQPMPTNGHTKKIANSSLDGTMQKTKDLTPKFDEVLELAARLRNLRHRTVHAK